MNVFNIDWILNKEKRLFLIKRHFLIQLWVWFWTPEEQHWRVTWTANSAGTGGLTQEEVLFCERQRGSCWGECSRSHKTDSLTKPLPVMRSSPGSLLVLKSVGWMTAPHLNSREQLLEEQLQEYVARTPLPPTYQLAREQAWGKGTAAIMNWSLPPLSSSKKRTCITTLCGGQCWWWNLSRRRSRLLHSQSRGRFKVYGRNGTCLTVGEGLKTLSLGKLGALKGLAWRKQASVASERCQSGRCRRGWFMPPYTYRVGQWRKWCHLVPQGSVHLRSNLYEPRHLAFFNQILAEVKNSESARDQVSRFVPWHE